MQSTLYTKLKNIWLIKPEFRLKVSLLSLTFLLMMACNVIWRPLKMAFFSKTVGAALIPDAKLLSLFFIIPLILIYSKLVDWLRRHHLLYIFNIAHGVGGVIFYILLSHPVYGIANTQVDSSRFLGWAFYFFMESFNAFLSTSFWAFADSINNPKDAKNYYGFIVSGSKIGGMVSAAIFYLVLTMASFQDKVLLPNALLVGSLMLLGAALTVYQLVKKVPENKMHGYEAVYQLEKQRVKTKIGFWGSIKSSFEGLILILKNPYVLGIFAIVACYEIIIAIFDYRMALQANSANPTTGSLTAFYALYHVYYNALGLIVSAFGTTFILKKMGFRFALFVFPLFSITLLLITYLFPVPGTLFITLVSLRAFNYALNHPTRETLYIPTTKNIKFKAKTWTDAFGSRIAKSSGSVINKAFNKITPSLALTLSMGLSLGLTSMWLIIVYFLGRTLQNAIDTKTVIGKETNDNKQETTTD